MTAEPHSTPFSAAETVAASSANTATSTGTDTARTASRDPVSNAGVVVVDKPAGMTSHDIVSRLRKIFKTRKVGHAGTLDPMATGVLVLGLERGTKLLGLLSLTTKSYTATIRLGMATDTDDAEGTSVFTSSAASVVDGDVDAAIAELTGRIMQVPATVSAIKIDGRRAYRRVRDGEDVSIPAREVTVSRFEITGRRRVDTFYDLEVEVDCTSGTYIRSLARDLGRVLGVGGHLTALRRTTVGPFTLADSSTLEQLENRPQLSMDIDTAITRSFTQRQLSVDEASRLVHGSWLEPIGSKEKLAAVAPDGRVIAIVEEKGRRAAPVFVVRPATL